MNSQNNKPDAGGQEVRASHSSQTGEQRESDRPDDGEEDNDREFSADKSLGSIPSGHEAETGDGEEGSDPGSSAGS
jgi:hypothetical protein